MIAQRESHRSRRGRCFFWLALAGLLGCHAVAASVRFEAEEQTLAAGAEKFSDPLASQGAAVRLGESGSIVWTVVLPAAGRYPIQLRYRAATGEKTAWLGVNNRELGLGLPYTGGEWAEARVVRTFRAGTNAIVLRKEWSGVEVDYLRFDFLGRGDAAPTVEFPVVTPSRNTRFTNALADAEFKLDRNGHSLRRVTIAGRAVNFSTTDIAYLDDAAWVRVPAAALLGLPVGRHRVAFEFENEVQAAAELELLAAPRATPWEIVTLDVNHGTAVFMRLPDGRNLLLDTGKPDEFDRVVLPWLRRQGVRNLDHLIITHYHDDHAGGLSALRRALPIGGTWDYRSFVTGATTNLGGVQLTALNTFADGTEENSRSLGLRFEYRGFVYIHGADNYAENQRLQRQRFAPGFLRAHVFHANHHFHGSADVGFLRALDPVLVLVSADQAVHARGTFTTLFEQETADYLHATSRRFTDCLVTRDIGDISLRIRDADDWEAVIGPRRPK